MLDTTASLLEHLVDETLRMMNEGATLDEIVHAVGVPAEYAELPYLQATYDEPEFVVRNIWRLYGGWYDGNPARLKPPADAALAAEVAALAGGADALAERARAVADAGDLRLACQLVEWAAAGIRRRRRSTPPASDVYQARRAGELSLMAKGIFGSAARRVRRRSPMADGRRSASTRSSAATTSSSTWSTASTPASPTTRCSGRSIPTTSPSRSRTLTGFLIQYWGGSTAYSDERGHPRLRMRHAPFVIGPAERDAWFRHMVAALNAVVAERDVPVEVEQAMRQYFEMSAEAMRNAP